MMAHNHGRLRPRPCCILALLLISPFLAACRSGVSMHVDGEYQPNPPGNVDFGPYNATPHVRLGGLGYPGPFTLFATADPAQLGHHSYAGEAFGSEEDRGIIYTRRAGFIDLAHTRKTIDTTKYVAVRVELALSNDWSALRLKSLEPSVYIIHFHYPSFWKSLPAAEKQQLAHELSIRIAQRMAVLMLFWHETLTWFGYKSAGLISEWNSAFAWDDIGAHEFGAVVADRALRDKTNDWDNAVTIELDRAFRDAGAVTPDQTMIAVRKIEGQWWSGSDPLKRWVELGWNDELVEAWLVRDLPFGDHETPYRYELPRLDDVMGRDFTGLVRIAIEPNVLETDKIQRVLPRKPAVIDVDTDMPVIIDHIKRWHLDHDGPLALRPY